MDRIDAAFETTTSIIDKTASFVTYAVQKQNEKIQSAEHRLSYSSDDDLIDIMINRKKHNSIDVYVAAQIYRSRHPEENLQNEEYDD